MISAVTVVLLILTVAAVAVLLHSLIKNKPFVAESKKKIRKKSETLEPTVFVDEKTIDKNCEICFGKIGSEMVRVCKCGKTFHIDCSDTTGECPYCRTKIDAMTERNSLKTTCPACGRNVEKNVCKCGVVIPKKDGSFECVCGENLSVKDKKCPSCGATFETEIREIK